MPMFPYGGNDDWTAVPSRSDALSILSRIETIEGPCPSFVCFGAPWPVACCTRSRLLLAHFSHGLMGPRPVHSDFGQMCCGALDPQGSQNPKNCCGANDASSPDSLRRQVFAYPAFPFSQKRAVYRAEG